MCKMNTQRIIKDRGHVSTRIGSFLRLVSGEQTVETSTGNDFENWTRPHCIPVVVRTDGDLIVDMCFQTTGLGFEQQLPSEHTVSTQ